MSRTEQPYSVEKHETIEETWYSAAGPTQFYPWSRLSRSGKDIEAVVRALNLAYQAGRADQGSGVIEAGHDIRNMLNNIVYGYEIPKSHMKIAIGEWDDAVAALSAVKPVASNTDEDGK